MDELGNQLVKIAAHWKIGKYISCQPFQRKTEIDKIYEIHQQSGNIHYVEKGTDKTLVYLMISEFKRDAVKKDNGKIEDEDRWNIEAQANEEYPYHLAETEIGKIMQVKQIEADPGKKKEDQNNQ